MSKSIFLIGMPGAGKTYWGEKLSRALNFPFFDLDEYIENRERTTISELFSSLGEVGFRQLESASLADIVNKQTAPFVLSCGGGTPLQPANLALMKSAGCVVYLKAAIETLLNNIKKQILARPLLQDTPDLVARLSDIYDKRCRVYEQANYTLEVECLTVSQFEPILAECIKPH
jgi:shikimate kinase